MLRNAYFMVFFTQAGLSELCFWKHIGPVANGGFWHELLLPDLADVTNIKFLNVYMLHLVVTRRVASFVWILDFVVCQGPMLDKEKKVPIVKEWPKEVINARVHFISVLWCLKCFLDTCLQSFKQTLSHCVKHSIFSLEHVYHFLLSAISAS